MVYPSLILAYMGQAAYLSKHHIIESNYRIGFYVSVPGKSLLVSSVNENESYLKYKIVTALCHCRESKVARSGNSHTCGCSRKSSCHNRNLLNYQTMFSIGLLSTSEDYPHIFQSTWPDLHSRDQLDFNALMLSCYCWV